MCLGLGVFLVCEGLLLGLLRSGLEYLHLFWHMRYALNRPATLRKLITDPVRTYDSGKIRTKIISAGRLSESHYRLRGNSWFDAIYRFEYIPLLVCQYRSNAFERGS